MSKTAKKIVIIVIVVLMVVISVLPLAISFIGG